MKLFGRQELKRVLMLPDGHTPYHDKRALEDLVMGQVVPAFEWDTLNIFGDWFDNHSISSHLKDPTREQSWMKESSKGIELLKQFTRKRFKRRIFIKGNHEEWFARMLKDKAPELYELFTSHDFLGLERDGWEVVPYMDGTKIGKLHVTHDVGYSGLNSAQQTQNSYGDNVAIGHNHNMTYVVRGNAKGEAHVGASFGWLGDYTKIEYRHRMKARKDWVLGFGVGYLRNDGVIHIQPVPIIDYTCVVEGRLFKA